MPHVRMAQIVTNGHADCRNPYSDLQSSERADCPPDLRLDRERPPRFLGEEQARIDVYKGNSNAWADHECPLGACQYIHSNAEGLAHNNARKHVDWDHGL